MQEVKKSKHLRQHDTAGYIGIQIIYHAILAKLNIGQF